MTFDIHAIHASTMQTPDGVRCSIVCHMLVNTSRKISSCVIAVANFCRILFVFVYSLLHKSEPLLRLCGTEKTLVCFLCASMPLWGNAYIFGEFLTKSFRFRYSQRTLLHSSKNFNFGQYRLKIGREPKLSSPPDIHIQPTTRYVAWFTSKSS